MRIKLISANFGDLSEVKFENKEELEKYDITFVNYSDDNKLYGEKLQIDNRLKSKVPKMIEWKNTKEEPYDYYIWIDSKFTIKSGFIEKMLEGIKGYDLCLFEHPERNTIKEELDFMTSLMNQGDTYLLSRYNVGDITNQVNKYLSDTTFIDNKLFACGCFIYTKELVANKEDNLMTEWILHNYSYSPQDQLSMPYLLQKYKTNYNVFDFNLLRCDYLKYN